MNPPHKPAPGRVAAAKRASAARTRAKHERWAAELREHGWTVTPPEDKPSNTASQEGPAK